MRHVPVLYQVLNRFERWYVRWRLPNLLTGRRRLVRTGGRMMVVEEATLTPAEALEASLDLVVEVAEKAGVPYFLVPTAGRQPRIGITGEHWQPLLDALAEAADRVPVYLAVPAYMWQRGHRRRTWWTELASATAVAAAARSARSARVFVPHPYTDQILKLDWACELDRWDAAGDGQYETSAPNRFTTRLEIGEARAESRAYGRTAATLPYFTGRHIFAVDFPIDLVMTWVDGADPEWLARKRAALEAATGQPAAESAGEPASPRLFRDNGELRFALRSIERNASWFRTLYLVTDDQVPDWLDTTNPRLRLVSHRELFDGIGHRPTFNSHAIAARLHHLPGLSDHYVYLNDDIFFGRPTTPYLFFLPNGMARFFLSKSTLPAEHDPSAPPHEQARRNAAAIIEKEFGVVATNNFFHAPVAQRRDVLTELEERFPDVFMRTWRSQFRSTTDVEVNGWLHHYWAYCSGRAEPATIRYDYFRAAADPAMRQRMAALLAKRDCDVFCINDDDDATEAERVDNVVDYLERYFPGVSSFEKGFPR